MSEQYTCESCNGVFNKIVSDEKAAEEFEGIFGRELDEDAALVCDDCYRKIMAFHGHEVSR